ncbi:MAG: GNAT family N-acetyltransferase [Anaerolineales bacterium]|nr:GNAT family N-acetyltransferase [Anaerolineales bacterium]
MFPFITLTDGAVYLRAFELGDAPALHQAIHESLPALSPWMSWANENYTLELAQRFITVTRAEWSAGRLYSFGVFDSQTNAFLGSCGLSHIHPVYHFCNLGYWIRTPQHGRGHAGRAAKLAAQFAFQRLNLIRAEIVIAKDNSASRRVAEKIGAHYEGILLNRMVVNKAIYDAHMFALIPADFGLVAQL